MAVNLLPDDKKNKDEAQVKNVRQVRAIPMSTPVSLDETAHVPVNLNDHSDSATNNTDTKLPVARKFSTIETKDFGSKNEPVVQREISAPVYVRDRSGRREPAVFAPRQNNKFKTLPQSTVVKVENMPNAPKKNVPDKMVESSVKKLIPSAEENLLKKADVADIKKEEPSKVVKADPVLPMLNGLKSTREPAHSKPKPIAPDVVRKTEKNSQISSLLLILLALVAGGVMWWGILYWHDTAVTAKVMRANVLEEQVNSLSFENNAGLKLDTQLRTISDWLPQVTIDDKIFNILEGTVLDEISYTLVEFDLNKFILKGYAPSYTSVAQQLQVFDARDDLSEVKLVEVKEVGSVYEFTLEGIVK